MSVSLKWKQLQLKAPTRIFMVEHMHIQRQMGGDTPIAAKINGSCDGQSNAQQSVSIANETAGGLSRDELDVCQCHLGNSRETPDLQHSTRQEG